MIAHVPQSCHAINAAHDLLLGLSGLIAALTALNAGLLRWHKRKLEELHRVLNGEKEKT